MSLSHSTLESLVRLGQFERIVSDSADGSGESHRSLSPDDQLVIAEAMARTGRLESAKGIARSILDRHEYINWHSKCEMILGLVARDLGRIDEAIQSLQHSVRLARERRDPAQAAHSALSAFRIVSERQPPEVVGSLLAEVRQLTTRAGDPHLTALLHESVARQEAQIGNLDEARRHLKIANNLLDTHPNFWLRQLCEINAFCIEFSSSELRLAEEHLRRAKELVAVSGALEQTVVNNLGHVYLQAGKFGKAERTLSGIADSVLPEVRQSALDGLARLYLATGRLAQCERVLDVLAGLQNQDQTAASFPVRSRLITQTRLLLHQMRWSDAALTASAVIEDALKVVDRTTLATGLILRALAMAKAGESTQASRAICAASTVGAWGIREHQGMFMHVYSQIQETRPALGLQSSRRARRVWLGQGNVCAESEFGEVLAAPEDRSSIGGPSEEIAELASRLTSSFVSAFDLAYDPQLLGTELLDAIKVVNCSPDAQLTKSRPDPTNSTTTDRCNLPLLPA